jgi:Concanavalin A-like lectin/glucanases superfamily
VALATTIKISGVTLSGTTIAANTGGGGGGGGSGGSFYYDFTNASSYPGSGSTVYDLSGQGNHGGLVGSPSYVTSPYKGMSFRGVGNQDYITIPSVNLNSDWTVRMILNVPISQQYWASFFGNDSYFAGQGFFSYLGSSSALYLRTPAGAILTKNGYNLYNSILFFVVTYTGTTASLYLNGTLAISSPSFPTPSFASNGMNIMARHQNNGTGSFDSLSGILYEVKVLDSAWDSTQVSSDYNTSKSKYGL